MLEMVVCVFETVSVAVGATVGFTVGVAVAFGLAVGFAVAVGAGVTGAGVMDGLHVVHVSDPP